MKPISVWGWLGGHDGQRPFGQIWPGCRGNTPTLFRRTSWDFNDHRESGPWFNVSFNISKSCNIKCCGLLLSWIWLPLTTYLAPHYSCTSPMDCISHHSLHSHIPIHHYTNHTAVTNHSLALIVSPQLHLIHTHTFKQHSYMHMHSALTAKSCSCPGWHFWALFILLFFISVFDPGLPDLGTLNLWPRLLPGIVYVSALPLIFLLLPADLCLFDSAY